MTAIILTRSGPKSPLFGMINGVRVAFRSVKEATNYCNKQLGKGTYTLYNAAGDTLK